MIGRMGASGLLIFIRPLMVSEQGFILTYFYLVGGGIIMGHVLIVFLIFFWNLFVGSFGSF
jgi:hypothetical protein